MLEQQRQAAVEVVDHERPPRAITSRCVFMCVTHPAPRWLSRGRSGRASGTRAVSRAGDAPSSRPDRRRRREMPRRPRCCGCGRRRARTRCASSAWSSSGSSGVVAGQIAVPDPQPVALVGQRELDGEVQPPHERVVHVAAEVGRQHDGPVVLLHPLQQVADLDVGVAVVRVLDLAALAEQRVGLVEEQDRARRSRPRRRSGRGSSRSRRCTC